MKILITGGSGLLGSHLAKIYPTAHTPTHSEMDITQPLVANNIDLVIHCAALKTTACDANRIAAMQTNIIGTANVAMLCKQQNCKMVYISTDYVFRGDRGNYAPDDDVCPQNYYAETKLAGEYVVKCLPDKNYLIIRLSFSPDSYPYSHAFTDQWTTRLTVSEAAMGIEHLISNNAYGIHHLCGPKRTVYDFAQATAGERHIQPMRLEDHPYKRPRDTSLVNGGT